MKKIYGLLLLVLCSCVSGRQYSRVSDAYTACRADSARMADSLRSLTRQKGELILKNIALHQDSIRIRHELALLRERYDRLLTSGSTEMADILRQMKESEEETKRISLKKSEAVVYQSEIGKTLSAVENELNIGLYGLDRGKTRIRSNKLAVVLSIDSDYFFTEGTKAVSPEGEKILKAVADILRERNLLNVYIVKYASVTQTLEKMNDPRTVNALRKINDLQSSIGRLEQEIAVNRDSMENIMQEQRRLSALDSVFLTRRDSLAVLENDAQEHKTLMRERLETLYSGDFASDSLRLAEAESRHAEIEAEIGVLDSLRKNAALLRTVSEQRLEREKTAADSLDRQKNGEIAAIYSAMRSIRDMFRSTNAEELSIITAHAVRNSGRQLGANKILAEQVFAAPENNRQKEGVIEIVIRPDMENIVTKKNNKRIYD